MLVQDPSMVNDVDAIFNQARQSRGVEIPADHLLPSSSSRSFTGTARLLTGETLPSAPQQPGVVTHEVVFWTNGVTVDGGSLRRLEDPENASFLESLCVRNNGKKWKCGKPVIPGSRPQYCSRHLAGYKGRQNERCMKAEEEARDEEASSKEKALIEDMESQLILWERKLNEQDLLVVELKNLLAHKKMKILEVEQIRKELHNTIMVELVITQQVGLVISLPVWLLPIKSGKHRQETCNKT